MEHRWGERVSLNLPVELLLAGGRRIDGCCLHDASASGCRVDMSRAFRGRHGVDVEVLVSPRDAQEDSLHLEGCVVRRLHRGFGFGIEWTELSPPGLARLIERNGPWRADAVGSPLPYA